MAFLPTGTDRLNVGYIDAQGQPQLFAGLRDRWQPVSFAGSPAVGNARSLVPGSPLALLPNGTGQPAVFTVGSTGQLLQLTGAGQRTVLQDVAFRPGAHLTFPLPDRSRTGFAIDSQGRLTQFDVASRTHQWIDRQPNRWSPGGVVEAVPSLQGFGRSPAFDVFAVDTRGSLYQYATGRGVPRPQLITNGFAPGAPVQAVRDGNGLLHLAGIDARGQLQLLSQRGGRWNAGIVTKTRFVPGTPVVLANTSQGLAVSSVGGDGIWRQWVQSPTGSWQDFTLNRGFAGGTPIAFHPGSQTGFGIDATGRLVAAGWWDGGWHSHLLLPDYDLAPRLIGRRVIPNQPLPPARVLFQNPSREEVVVQLDDALDPRGPQQHKIPAGGAIPLTLPRDAGGLIEERYAVFGPGGWVERVDQFGLPPVPRHTAVVWANRTTYQYIDKKGVSVLPDFDLKTHVSLGVFELPPGELLRDGEQVDVYGEAVARRNPGAAAWFGPPAGGPEVVVHGRRTAKPVAPQNVPNPPATRTPNNPLTLPPLPTAPSGNSTGGPPQGAGSGGGPRLPPLPR